MMQPRQRKSPRSKIEQCAICQCPLHRTQKTYARPTIEGRSHATKHHFVAKRFFGRSSTRPGTTTDAIFACCPWKLEKQAEVFCYECHEELLHNPVLLPQDIIRFAKLVEKAGLSETQKTKDRSKIAGRIKLFQEVIACGLAAKL